ncbi:MAG: hypothetical protein K8F91_17035, partial [Candidatus Obscuribacterales bacterium]|nr:hypothetical protein [Candidatus Obscuribacterales bacterium]
WGPPPSRTRTQEKPASTNYELEHHGEQGEKLLLKTGIQEQHEKPNESLDTNQIGMMALSGHPVAQAGAEMLKTPAAQDKEVRDGIKKDISSVLGDWFKERFHDATNVVSGFDKWVTSALNVQNLRNFGEGIRKAAFGHHDSDNEPIRDKYGDLQRRGVKSPQDVAEYGVSTVVGVTKALSHTAPLLTPQGFAKANHELADGGREAIKNAGEYYGQHGVSKLPGDTADATKTAYDRLGQWSTDRMTMEPGERGDLTGSAMAAAGFFLMGKRILNDKEAANVLGVEETALAAASEEQLAARGLTKIPKDKLPIAKDGNPLQFTDESGIEMVLPTDDVTTSIWEKGWSTRGFEAEGEMGSSGILARNFPRVDDGIFQDGIFTSFKSIDLEGTSYQSADAVFRKLDGYLEKLNDWNGQKKFWGGRRILSDQIEQKVLHIGIPNNAITVEQMKAFEKLGKRSQALGIKIKVTVIE